MIQPEEKQDQLPNTEQMITLGKMNENATSCEQANEKGWTIVKSKSATKNITHDASCSNLNTAHGFDPLGGEKATQRSSRPQSVIEARQSSLGRKAGDPQSLHIPT